MNYIILNKKIAKNIAIKLLKIEMIFKYSVFLQTLI